VAVRLCFGLDILAGPIGPCRSLIGAPLEGRLCRVAVVDMIVYFVVLSCNRTRGRIESRDSPNVGILFTGSLFWWEVSRKVNRKKDVIMEMREEAFPAGMVMRDGWFDVVRGYWTDVGAGPGG
jgi:hypothetical protein